MLKWLKISHRHHSGRLRPHEHTSYPLLGLVLLITGLPLTAYTVYAESPGPASSAISLTGSMPGKAPTVAATIDVPTNQQHFTTSPIVVSGTCPDNTLVEIFKNDIFAGSTACADSGTYSLEIDLLVGQNILLAKVYDSLNQVGPDSNLVTVFYDALPSQSEPLTFLNLGGTQLLLNTDAVFRGVFPDRELNVPINIIGGTQPYAINIQWGDSENTVISRNDNIGFIASHSYKRAGTYQMSIQATDSTGRVAFLTVAVIVNGTTVATTASLTSTETNNLLVLWPLYIAAIAVVISFFLGEQREKRVLRAHGLLLPS